MKKLAVACSVSASITLIFDGLSPVIRDQIDIFSPFEPLEAINTHIAGAAAVLVARDIHVHALQEVAKRCLALRVPFYFYTEDNFWILARDFPEFSWFSTEEARTLIASAAGVVVSSDALANFVIEGGWHKNILRCSPALMPDLIPQAPPWWSRIKGPRSELRLVAAFSGGGFREAGMRCFVGPALSEVSAQVPTQLIVRAGNPIGLNSAVQIIEAGFYLDFREFILHWRAYKPQALLQPRGDTLNAPYKTANALLVSYLLGAVPIISDEAAYTDVDERHGVLRAADDAKEWATALRRLLNPSEKRKLFGRLETWCKQVFNPTLNEQTVLTLLGKRSP
jgi:hypothetical protein